MHNKYTKTTKKIFTFLFAAIALASCGTNPLPTPQPVQSETTPAIDTAILVATDQQDPTRHFGHITHVNGKPVECSFNYGCPFWVRIPAGTNSIVIKYRSDFHGFMGERYANIDLGPIDMKATHVYAVKYSRTADGKSVNARVVDLGAKPDFCLTAPFGAPPGTPAVLKGCATF